MPLSAPVIAPIGAEWPQASLVWGGRAGSGAAKQQVSVIDGSMLQQTCVLGEAELRALVQARPRWDGEPAEFWQFVDRLHLALSEMAPLLREALPHETGFVARDCDELIAGSLDLVRGFRTAFADGGLRLPTPVRYDLPGQRRQVRLSDAPWGTVAVILPQNAFLLVALTALLSGLATGNRVILRAPQQSARSAALLAAALQTAQPPDDSVSLVLADARGLIDALCLSPQLCLIHYLGSSQHAPALLSKAFENGNGLLADGGGNCWVYVGADAAVEEAVETLTAGALRYNGQTCTSVNGAMIHPDIYPEVRRQLLKRWPALRAGSPLDSAVDVGPLFDAAQAQWCEQQILESGGTVLCGGGRTGNLLEPALVEGPKPDSGLVREGLFGPALWMASGEEDDFVDQWPSNRYPLGAGVLSPAADVGWWTDRLSNLARLSLNGDPSIEATFEPWGGYPASGLNPVSLWHHKYRRVVMVDEAEPAV